jgi:nitrile hydratase subunit beta
MDGIHDLGGKQGYGPVDVDANASWHETWESRMFALVNCAFRAGLIGNLDQFRHAIERIAPTAYLQQGYFGRWTGGLENLLVESGVLTSQLIDERAGELGQPGDALTAARPSPHPDRVDSLGGEPGFERSIEALPRFVVGQPVLTRSHASLGHTRLPAYVRGRTGTITAWHRAWVLPDTNAHGLGEHPEHLYTVAFTGRTLWGESVDPHVEVCIDLFESYLSPLEPNHA